MTSRERSGIDADWGMGQRSARERRVGTRNNHQAGKEANAKVLPENEKSANSIDKRLEAERAPGMGRRRSRVSLGKPGANMATEASRERLLWDELRESVEGVAGSAEVPAPSMWGRVGPVGKNKEEIVREERRRRLIDEAIAVLLEGSSSGSSDDERLEDDDAYSKGA